MCSRLCWLLAASTAQDVARPAARPNTSYSANLSAQAHRVSWAKVLPVEAQTAASVKLQAHVVVIAQAHLLAASQTALLRSASPLTKKGQISKSLSV